MHQGRKLPFPERKAINAEFVFTQSLVASAFTTEEDHLDYFRQAKYWLFLLRFYGKYLLFNEEKKIQQALFALM